MGKKWGVVRGPESYGLSGAIVGARYIFTSRFFVDSAVVRPFDNGFAPTAVPNNLMLSRLRGRTLISKALCSAIINSVFESN